MAFQARKATRKQAKARVLVDGPSGSGKTYSSLLLASGIASRIAVIDTEHSSADLYADVCEYDVIPFDPPYEPERYIEAIDYAVSEGYDCIVVDSIAHEWNGKGGCLDIQTKLGGRFQDWAKVTPRHQAFVDAILRCPAHIICTCRTKTVYEVSEKNGRKGVEKLGSAPQQREGLDYEMTVVFDLNQQHMASASKDRTRLFDGREHIIDQSTGKRLADWLNGGAADYVAKRDEFLALARTAASRAGKEAAVAHLAATVGVESTKDVTDDQLDLATQSLRELIESAA